MAHSFFIVPDKCNQQCSEETSGTLGTSNVKTGLNAASQEMPGKTFVQTSDNTGMCYSGSIPGELSFAANSRELARTRANSRELRANSPTVRQHRQSAELRRTFAGVRRTFAGVRRSSPGFARVRAHSAANSRTVRQKIRSPEEIYPPLTVVRRERSSRRT